MNAEKLNDLDSEVTILSTKAYEVIPEIVQTRAGLDAEFSRMLSSRLAKTGMVHLTPVLVYRLTQEATRPDGSIIPEGAMVLADGHHRHDAIIHLRRPHGNSIRAIVRDGTIEDAILAGLEANKAVIDRRITEDDRLHAVKVMIRNPKFNAWSDGEIGRRCGVKDTTVSRARIRLLTDEGIPLPEKIRCFSRDGNPTEKWSKYKRVPGSLPSIYKHKKNGFRAEVGGRKIHLGTNYEKAVEKLSTILSADSPRLRFIFDQDSLQSLLIANRIPCSVLSVEEYKFGGLVCGDVVVRCATADNFASFCEQCLKLILSMKVRPDFRRAVLVGRFLDMVKIGQLLPALDAAGVRVMTPEEFVDEFAPKDGEPSSE